MYILLVCYVKKNDGNTRTNNNVDRRKYLLGTSAKLYKKWNKQRKILLLLVSGSISGEKRFRSEEGTHTHT